MHQFAPVLLAVLQVFVIIGLGFGVRRVGWVKPETDSDLMKLILNLLFPCFIIHRISADPLMREGGTVTTAAALGFGFIVFAVAISYVVAPALKLRKGKGRRTFAVSCGIQNYGFVAIPVLETVTGGNEATGVLIMHNVGVDIAIWSVCLMVMTGAMQSPLKKLANGPLIAIVIGLTLNYTGAGEHVLRYAGGAIEALGNCSIPLSLVLIGTTLADLTKNKVFKESLRVGMGSIVLRLVILAIPFLLAAEYLVTSRELKIVLIVEASMPAAVFPIVMARHYGGHPETAVRVVTYTTVASLITTPLVISLGFWFTNTWP